MNVTVDFQNEQINDKAPNDSLTLGQLKKIVKQFPNKQKVTEKLYFAFFLVNYIDVIKQLFIYSVYYI